jgi:hypothetical protein
LFSADITQKSGIGQKETPNVVQVKWTLVVCVFCYSTYIAAQFYPRFYTLIPSAMVLGMGAAPLWSSESTYLTQVAQR